MCKQAFISLVLGCTLLTGCMSTRMTTFTDPECHEHVVARLLVVPLYEDLGLRRTAETAFVTAFSRDSSAEVIPSLELLPPTREVSGAALSQLLRDRQIDSVLVIEQTGADFRLEGSGHLSGSNLRFSAERVTSDLSHSLRLFDVSSDQTAWIASARTYESGLRIDTIRIHPGFSTFMKSLAEKTVRSLRADGHLRAQ